MDFEPDYRNMEAAARNRRPPRLPVYEHLINVESMEGILGRKFGALWRGTEADRLEFFRHYCGFFREMTYDTVSFEVCVTSILPGGGALLGERPGPIQSRRDFDAYPWKDLPRLFWQRATPCFDALAATLPSGMKAVGGIGNGLFEISEDLVGFQNLCYLQADDPELFAEVYRRIGDLLVDLWTTFLQRHSRSFVICRIGDDMGFKTGTLLAPSTLIDHVVPQYRRVIRVIHDAGFPFLFHSCGCIFDLMKPLIEAGIDGKHSNEDVIAPFDQWIDRYGDRIGFFGGIDTDRLCRMPPDRVYEFVVEEGTRFRRKARGYALGSGNSIPGYVPRDGYLAMIRAAQEIRRREAKGRHHV
jgi:uroporphyrinogen decarboxylase